MISMVHGNGFPVIVSDRAISREKTNSKIISPATGIETLENTAVIEFTVKSMIIKELLCVAFAGNVHDIIRIRAEVIDYFTHRQPNQETLGTFIKEMDPSWEARTHVP